VHTTALDRPDRRRRLAAATGPDTWTALVGHDAQPRNYPANLQPFRQDSSFLYLVGQAPPGAAALIGPGGALRLFFVPPEADDALWHGAQPPWEETASALGAESIAPASDLPGAVQALRSAGARVLALPVTQRDARERLEAAIGHPIDPRADHPAVTAAMDAVIALRLTKEPAEIERIRAALDVTGKAHRAAMAATRPGLTDLAIHALVESIFAANGMAASYPSIVTAQGEVLHGHATGHVLAQGELLLIDAGAEHPDGYASDVTRTWPVSGRLTGRQRAVYEAVLDALDRATAACVPGARYRDVHLTAARALTEAALDWGLLRGDPDDLVAAGAHAVFYPHGTGHLLGLDVHDMELYWDRAGYAPGRTRSAQFGLGFLRLDRDLEPGMVFTVEPGFYLAPAILHDQALRDRLGDRVAWGELERWLPFGGIRLEDDVLVTPTGPVVLSADIPKAPDEVTALVGSGSPTGGPAVWPPVA
jgi:Xaa-Pro aminopeptidase